MKPIFSVIIIGKSVNSYLIECLQELSASNFKNFETLVVLDKKPQKIDFSSVKFLFLDKGPAEKRDFAASFAKGDYLAFIDDDAYPSPDWLKHALRFFSDKDTAAVCGPGVTPPNDSILQKVSGWVSSTKIGLATNTYRFTPEKERYVDDYPSMNFIIKKNDFKKVGGFDTNYWPGEDTKLCRDIVKKLKKKIFYHPSILVFHHRRPIFKEHLLQNSRYGLHRGYFAKILPETSFRLSYLPPPLFTLGFFIGPFSYFIDKYIFYSYIAVLSLYLSLVILTSFWIHGKEKNLLIATLFIPAVITTHFFYGLKFIQGFLFSKKLKQ
jgi:GT2 family glycosyltransferase